MYQQRRLLRAHALSLECVFSSRARVTQRHLACYRVYVLCVLATAVRMYGTLVVPGRVVAVGTPCYSQRFGGAFGRLAMSRCL